MNVNFTLMSNTIDVSDSRSCPRNIGYWAYWGFVPILDLQNLSRLAYSTVLVLKKYKNKKMFDSNGKYKQNKDVRFKSDEKLSKAICFSIRNFDQNSRRILQY